MEPTIYKPSIYKGAGIYKTGAGGGGGGANFDFGQMLEPKTMPDGRIWATKNLILAPYPHGATGYNDLPNDILDYGLLMDWDALQYIITNKEIFCPGWNVPTRNEFKALFSACNNNYSTLNNAGFNIQLCGRKSAGSWDGIRTFGQCWSRTSGGVGAYRAFMSPGIGLDADNTDWLQSLMAVRLIKDL